MKTDLIIQDKSKETLVYFSRTERKIISEMMESYASEQLSEQRRKIEELRDVIESEIVDLDETLTSVESLIFLTDNEIELYKAVKHAKVKIRNKLNEY